MRQSPGFRDCLLVSRLGISPTCWLTHESGSSKTPDPISRNQVPGKGLEAELSAQTVPRKNCGHGGTLTKSYIATPAIFLGRPPR